MEEIVTLSSEMEKGSEAIEGSVGDVEGTSDGKDKGIAWSKDKIEEPTRDMVFDNVDEMISYYTEYGRQKGFGVAKRTQSKTEGVVSYVTVGCHRGGKSKQSSKNILKPDPVTRTDCKARICAKLCEDMKWRVGTVETNHNHPCNPSKVQRYWCKRRFKPHSSGIFDLNEGSSSGSKKCNDGQKATRLMLDDGDGASVLSYFNKLKKIDKEFSYSVDFDEENRVRNLFWADARSKAAYGEFCDVVSFDTTCLTNKYKMPLVYFLGVNHHGQSTLLGCGLIASEDMETYVWLFEAWLDCMSGNAPNVIITDQDMAMTNALEVVFPNICHMWCLRHIMTKITENLRRHEQYESLKILLQNIVHESILIVDFEIGWRAMVLKYKLESSDWLEELYNERHHWVPCFVKDFFSGGMSTTESTKTFFDGHVNAQTSLKQFVEIYDNALVSKVEEENDADFDSFNLVVPTITHYPMEKQFQGVYTISKFREFQEQLAGLMYCVPYLLGSNGAISEYEVTELIFDKEKKGNPKRVPFIVCLKLENVGEFEVKCNCRLFESCGILCRHTLSVLIRNDLYTSIPTKYILRRWRKDISRCHTKTRVPYCDWLDTEEGRQYHTMCKLFHEVAEIACESEDKSKMVITMLLDLKNEILKDDGVCGGSKPPRNHDSRAASRIESVASQEMSSISKHRKGQSLTKRKNLKNVQTILKRRLMKKDAMNSECEEVAEDDHTPLRMCGNLIETQERMHRQTLNSSAAGWLSGSSFNDLWSPPSSHP